jgi:hypothetical protein
MLDGWRKSDPANTKKSPVEADVPKFLCTMGAAASASPLDAVVGNLTLIAYYYLLRVGEYTCKRSRNKSKQTVQFKLEDVIFFSDHSGRLQQVPRDSPVHVLLSAKSATLKLDNQKNGWKGVCIHQEYNGKPVACLVRALARQVIHIRQHSCDPTTFLSAYFNKGRRCDVTDRHISAALKVGALALGYPGRGFPIDHISMHSLRSGGANALSLAGYSDRHIQKMGRWKGSMFEEYIREELHVFSQGMSTHMKKTFKFVNIAGSAFDDVTALVLDMKYTVNVAAA